MVFMDGWPSLGEGTGLENQTCLTTRGGSNPSPSLLSKEIGYMEVLDTLIPIFPISF